MNLKKWLRSPIAVVLALAIVISCVSGLSMLMSASADDVLIGDVNGDGSIGKADLDALRELMASGVFTPAQLMAGDLDGDGTLTAVDFQLLRKLIGDEGEFDYNEAGMRTYTATVSNPTDKVNIMVMGRRQVLARGEAELTYGAFEYGESIEITSDYRYLWVQLNDILGETLVYSPSGNFTFQIPESTEAYAANVFKGASNKIKARVATDNEVKANRNLAVNVYDFMYLNEQGRYEAPTADLVNDSVSVEKGDVRAYPHAYANRVTENKQIFMARNAIDGVTTTGNNHNDYPHQSWGCGKNDDAQFVIYFGREVSLSELAFVLRADFGGNPPHDTYWESLVAEFSDGSTQNISLQKGGNRQVIDIDDVTTSSVRIKNMVRHVDNSQMWAALIELEAIGKDTVGNTAATKTYVVPDHGGKDKTTTTDSYKSDEIAATMKQVYEYFRDNIGVTAIGWKEAVYYIGVMDAFQTTGDLDYYLNCRDTADFRAYGVNGGALTDFGDDYAISQMYIALNALAPDSERKLKSPIANADFNMQRGKVEYWWCDALFMSGMVFTELSQLTGDRIYTDTEYASYLDWYGTLYNSQNDLWWRDTYWINKQTTTGKPVFWSRGNAWVFAYLARQLSYIQDTDSAIYQRLLADYKKMAVSLKALQRADGTWNPCLNDPAHFGGKETTGTAGFLYGFAVGVQLGILDKETYLPTALKAYDALTGVCMIEPGKIGYMEKEAAEPDQYVSEEYSRNLMNSFGTGLFLMGASALMRACEDYEDAYIEMPLDLQDEYGEWPPPDGYYEGPITATASSSDSNPPSGAFDHIYTGAPGTRWSANGVNNWLMADFGKEVPIYMVSLHPLDMRDYRYKIEVSDNGLRWVEMVDRTQNSERAARYVDTFAPVSARYVRLTITGAATYTGGFTSIAELFLYEYLGNDKVNTVEELYQDPFDDTVYIDGDVEATYTASQPDADYYTGAVTVTASDEQDWENNYASNLCNKIWTDAAQGSRWAAQKYPQWAMVDFGKVLELTQMTLMVYQGRQYYYQLEVSTNGTDWKTAALIRQPYTTAANHTYKFEFPVEARYVRLNVIGANASSYSSDWISINELLVYTADGGGTIDPPDPGEPLTLPNVTSSVNNAEPSNGYYTDAVTITASDEQRGTEANYATCAYDKDWSGVNGTRWAAMNYPQWIMFDLGSEVSLSKISAIMYDGREYYYKLEVSKNGTDWATVSEKNSPYFGGSNHTFSFAEDVSLRYIKLTITGKNDATVTSGWVGVNEILLYQ